MSTSDPDRPTDDTATVPAQAPADEATTSVLGAPVADEPRAAASPAVNEAPTDTGRHAVVRPAPTPPPPTAPASPAPAPARATTTAPAGTPTPTGSASDSGPATAVVPPTTHAPSTAPQPVVAADPSRESTQTTPPAADDDELFPDPNAPRSTSFGTHVLGSLVGLVLGPAAAGTLLLGQARILEAQADGWTDTVDTVGIVLVGVGLLLLGWVALLAIWTPAVPITAGIVLSGLGGVALIAPGVARDLTLRYIDSSGWHLTITQVLVAGTSGTLLTAGFLLLLAGLVAVAVKRRGLRLGEFRERHRTASS
ncbi:hypothetical protein [Cellulomonas edaphi]|uniref:Uncharacterized protein n=1 Tax=Cellulomonas edaphi TaxID=3053468 RepID=A0ABT7S9N6_9CELL|nr:hypothetical protein [Cellulomons edaphi]MDM7832296.1 hypothetical protein [Cellulomons edaphi]